MALGVVGLLLLDATTRSSLTAFPFGYIGLYVLGASLAAAQVDSVSERLRTQGLLRPAPQPLLEPST